MGLTEPKMLKTVREFNRYRFLKKVLQLLLSISFFSFLLSDSSSWLSFLLCFLNKYVRAFPFQLFTYPIDRIYLFLLCNGILVFLTKISGLIGSSPFKTDLHEVLFEKNGTNEHSVPQVLVTTASVKQAEVPGEGTGSIGNDVVGEVKEEKGRENGFLITKDGEGEVKLQLIEEDGDDDVEKEEDCGIMISEEEEEMEERNRLLSAEELKKIFDDFIKKKKEEIRIEAQRQLIMV